jgi:serine/threonine-protein kinase RsbT
MNIAEALRSSLRSHLSLISIDSLIQRHVSTPAASVRDTPRLRREEIAERLMASARLFSASDPSTLKAQIRIALQLDEATAETAEHGSGAREAGRTKASGGPRVQLVHVRGEIDVSVARNEARRMVMEMGLSGAMPVKVATTVSELARNIVLYASTGSIAIETSYEKELPVVRIVARDEGPGISASQLESMFAGTYRSKSGLGKGLAAVKRVATEFSVNTALGKGTIVHATFRGAT